MVKKSLLSQGQGAEAVPEEGVEVAAKEGPLKLAQMGPQQNQPRTGALGMQITLRTGAAEHIGNGARVHIIAATEPFAPGETELCLDPHNSNRRLNRNRNRKDKINRCDK